MSVLIDEFIRGTLVTQGSTKGFYNRRKGRVVITHEHDSALRFWRLQISTRIRQVWRAPPLDCAVAVMTHFFITRPPIAKNRPLPFTKPDLDKLQRAIGDALEGSLLTNDSRITMAAQMKRYGPEQGVRIIVIKDDPDFEPAFV